MVYLITAKKDAGKTHYGNLFGEELKAEGYKVIHLDGDEFRGERKNNDFTDKGRIKNLTDAAKLAAEFESKGYIVILSFVAPRKEWRYMMRSYWKESIVVYLPGGILWPGTTYDRPDKDELMIHDLYSVK